MGQFAAMAAEAAGAEAVAGDAASRAIVDGQTRVRVTGAKEIAAALRGLPLRVRKNAIRRGLYRAAAIIRDRARANVPVDTGALRSAIIAKVSTSQYKKGTMYASAGVVRKSFARGKREGKQPRRYAHLVEFGTPNVAPRPFMRPAIEGSKIDVIDSIGGAVNEELAKAAAESRRAAK